MRRGRKCIFSFLIFCFLEVYEAFFILDFFIYFFYIKINIKFRFSHALNNLMKGIEANLSHKNLQNFQKNFVSFKEHINEVCG
jgi:hypothetical protein